ncbi:hypothetical protein D3C72_1964050 [compost metagenome]
MPKVSISVPSRSVESLPSSSTCQKLTVTSISSNTSNRSDSLIQRDSGASVCAARSTITLCFGLVSKPFTTVSRPSKLSTTTGEAKPS